MEIENKMGKGDLRKEVEEQGDKHPLMQERQSIEKEINSLQQRLEGDPLEDDVNTWNQQQEGKRLEIHRGLFNEFEQKWTRLLEIEKEMEKGGQGDEHPLMPEMRKLDDEVDSLGEYLKKGPLKKEVEDWYER